jgi:phenylalanyl-tRNA synthetase beta chain
MKISLDWLGDYVKLPRAATPQKLMHDLTMSTVEVEAIEDISRHLDGIVLARIDSFSPHPSRGKLRVVECDIGTKKKQRVVTGAANVREGMLVALAIPGAAVVAHASADSADLCDECGFAHAPNEAHVEDALRRRVAAVDFDGVVSEGMLCGADEIGLEGLAGPSSKGGLLDLGDVAGAPGQRLAEIVGWDDHVLEIDNKSLTNRPDLWCHWGIARELAAIYGVPFTDVATGPLGGRREKMLGAIDAAFCPRISVTRYDGVSAAQSPLFVRSRLARLGQRTSNILVDLTNYVMFDIGQPCHAYDAEKLALPIGVRAARAGESIRLLDGVEGALEESAYVISSGDGAVGVAGVMGGKDSSVSETTNAIVLETASFAARSVRRSARTLNMRSEAAARYEKAIDTQRIDLANARFAALLAKYVPGAVATSHDAFAEEETQKQIVAVDAARLSARLGSAITGAEIQKLLTPAGFEVRETAESELEIVAPTWRSTGDVSGPHDILEEVARFQGYDNIVGEGVSVVLKHAMTHRAGAIERRLREVLAHSAGMIEIVTYPWMESGLAEIAGIDVSGALELAAPPSPEERMLRVSMVPGILHAITKNDPELAGFRLFEIGPVFRWAEMSGSSRQVRERAFLAGALAGDDPDLLLRQAKGVVEALPRLAHLDAIEFSAGAAGAWCDVNGSMLVRNAAGEPIGGIGVLSPRVRAALGLRRNQAAVFEIALDGLTLKPSRENVFVAPSERPDKAMDLSLLFPNTASWAAIRRAAEEASPLIQSVEFVDEFRGAGVPADARGVTLRLRLAAPNRTLSTDEARPVADAVRVRLAERLNASERSDLKN